MCFLNQRKTSGKPPEPTQQELVVTASEEAGVSKKHCMLANSREQERSVMLVEESLHSSANTLSNQDPSKGLES